MLVIVLSMSALLVLAFVLGAAVGRRRARAPGARFASAAAHDAREHLPECGDAAQGQALAAFYAYQLGSARAGASQ